MLRDVGAPTKGSIPLMGTTIATMIAGVFTLASGLSGEYDGRASQPLLSSQPATVTLELPRHAGHSPVLYGTLCAFCSQMI